MRALDHDVEHALALFPHVYRREAFAGTWQLLALPRVGAVGDQDARLMQLFEIIATTLDAVAHEAEQRRKRDADVSAWRDERARRG